ncbi:MAG: glycosyltransferase, partial [Myxococcaceae bacterium]|nr:glycosyltransferase [Myxococcaceae bacterium]
HQLIPSFKSGDATGQAALHFQLLLRRMGQVGHIYAGEVEPTLDVLARPARALRPEPGDLVLYHHGIASHLAGEWMHLPCRRGLVFHNVTPARYFAGTRMEEALVAGRAQLAAMAPFADVAIGVSDYNSAELRASGFRNVHTVPLFVEPERFGEDMADPKLLGRLRPHSPLPLGEGKGEGAVQPQSALRPPTPLLVAVSRILPHKRFEDVLALHAEHLRLRPDARLALVGGYDAGAPYVREVLQRARSLPNVELLGRVSHAQLVAVYRAATLFVSMSEHEGFGVPLLEAMAAGVPVLAFAAAAVPETLGGAGVAFTEKRFAFLAELVHQLHVDGTLRERVLAGQARRVRELSAESAQVRLQEALAHLLPSKTPGRRTRGKRKVALVVQRYGDVGGGAERHAQWIAERLAREVDLTVLTTCASDHLTWANTFPPGEERVGRVRVLRFPSVRTRTMRRFNALSRELFAAPQPRVSEEQWVAAQGPDAPGLLRHLAEEADGYDAFVFFTYLYAPTVLGLPLVARKSLLVPTAHDEPPLRFRIYDEVFTSPRALLCNTPEEETLIRRRFPHAARGRVVGVGVDAHEGRERRFREKYGFTEPYLLYVGRLEPGKGIPELLKHHARLRARFHDAPQLLLAGTKAMELKGDGVRYLGRISDEDKHDALAGALAAVVPSQYESLSLLTLEAFAQGTPAIVNGRSEVLAGQAARSGAGIAYTDADSFVDAVRRAGELRDVFGKKGRAFARQHTWERVMDAYREELEKLWGGRKS